MKRFITLILSCLLCLPWFTAAAATSKPNIVVILADLGYGDVGCYTAAAKPRP